jgi:hypothetical protein
LSREDSSDSGRLHEHGRAIRAKPSELRINGYYLPPAKQQRELDTEFVAHESGGIGQEVLRDAAEPLFGLGDHPTNSAYSHSRSRNLDFSFENSQPSDQFTFEFRDRVVIRRCPSEAGLPKLALKPSDRLFRNSGSVSPTGKYPGLPTV